MSSSQSYTCITCRVAFATPDLQRAHYKSDWHRYNLKRKVAEMPAITAEDFKQRVLAQQAQTAEAQKDTTTTCKVCSKHFNTKNAFSNHLKSKKHREIEAKLALKQQSEIERRNAKNREKGLEPGEDVEMDNKEKESAAAAASSSSSSGASNVVRNKSKAQAVVEPMEDGEEEEEEEWEDVEGDDIAVTDCLFCNHSSSNMEKNVEHMTKGHSFFLPNIEFLVDLEGMLTYLGEKVGGGFLCLWCNETGRAFYSLEAVQNHMQDKGHCKLQCDGDAVYEFAEFYDFRKSYPDHEKNSNEASSSSSADDGATPMEEDEEHIEKEAQNILQDGYELVLPSGARIGHREMQVYYKQNIPIDRQIAKRPGMINRLMAQYKSLGWTGTTGDAAQKKLKDLRYIQKIRDKHHMRLGVKANKFQPHLRPQVVF